MWCPLLQHGGAMHTKLACFFSWSCVQHYWGSFRIYISDCKACNLVPQKQKVLSTFQTPKQCMYIPTCSLPQKRRGTANSPWWTSSNSVWILTAPLIGTHHVMQWIEKPHTHTAQYLNVQSHHLMAHKCAAVTELWCTGYRVSLHWQWAQ